MLAAHRDQENLVHSQQVPAKQQHKTPGARFPKTPSRFPQHDENAPTAFAGKTGLGGAKSFLGNDKTATKGNGTRQALVTPMGTRSRAPLGNKTTNAKARAGQAGGVKDIVKDLEKTQLKPTAQKPKQRPIDLAPLEIRLKDEQQAAEQEEEDEPEYAPPKPKDLPYESDVFPKDLLTLDGLKKENLFKGYYQHFYNPVDDDGVSRQDREFEETMKKVAAKAEERNKQETDALSWNVEDLSDTEEQAKPVAVKKAAVGASDLKARGIRSKQPSSLASRRAASALSIHSDTSNNTKVPTIARTTKTRRPLSSLMQGRKPAVRGAVPTKTSPADSATGEAASRTTIGYSRGRSASSMMQAESRGTGATVRPQRPVKPVESIDSIQSDMTITPARLRQAALKKQESQPRPQFMSIFDEDGEDDDLAPLSRPLELSDDEEDFELKLNF
ncbi:hypothetical protein FZEAL_992 [Fusarium zealandicum]|uniref:Uncharacterized protein n=1 Tax=Fusarium zealandicum TaxID=1053134 RepID=A0A8H4XQC9_9HYPO|nr:hypothetical protein FZEAL_992 [Fusarium zealandicum]